MKSRLTLIFAALVVLLGSMIWVVQDRRTTNGARALAAADIPLAPATITPAPASIISAPAPAPALAAAPVPIVAPTVAVPVAPAKASATPSAPAAPAAPIASAPAPAAEGKSSPIIHVAASGAVNYIARDGDTLSQLAIALLGSDSQEHRDAVIDANPSLKSNPDRVLTGQTYLIALPLVETTDAANSDQETTAKSPDPVAAATPEKKTFPVVEATPKEKPAVADGPKLKYSAQRGDTVRVLAANLLGGDTKLNRDAIIAGNKSLQNDPDHMVAGKSYTIPGANGLAADPNPQPAKTPTTRPDADDVIQQGAGRTLRYTAQSGDSVSKLAIVLMGSDTQANRDLIIKNNPSLKNDPNHLSVGQTYWIAAPTADSKP